MDKRINLILIFFTIISVSGPSFAYFQPRSESYARDVNKSEILLRRAALDLGRRLALREGLNQQFDQLNTSSNRWSNPKETARKLSRLKDRIRVHDERMKETQQSFKAAVRRFRGDAEVRNKIKFYNYSETWADWVRKVIGDDKFDEIRSRAMKNPPVRKVNKRHKSMIPADKIKLIWTEYENIQYHGKQSDIAR